MLNLILDHWRSGANQDAADEALRTGKPVKLGPLERLYGGKVKDAQNIVDTANQKELNRTYTPAAVAAGLKPFKSGFANYGESGASLATRIQQAAEAKVKKAKAEQEAIDKSRREEGYKHANDLLAAQLKSSELQANTTLQSQENRFAHTSKQNALTRAHEMERADKRDALSLQIQVMQNDLADKRMSYDRETARMDKRDQRLAELTSSLIGLGSIFA